MINEIIKTAKAELGTREVGQNIVKYNDEYWGPAYRADGASYPWCVVFLWWVFKHSGASDLFPNTAHCDGVRSYAQSIGRWFTPPIDYKVGDLIIWDYNLDGSGDHIGMVTKVLGSGIVEDIEGNSGDAVAIYEQYPIKVLGVYRPNYANEAADDVIEDADGADESVTEVHGFESYPLLAGGYIGEHAALLQAKLAILGYNIGDIDGEVGPYTMAAVAKYQKDVGLTVDGIAGPETFKSLWEGGI